MTPSPNNIKIRNATEDDISSIRDIYNYYIRETTFTFEEVEVTLEEMTNRYRHVLELKLPYFVAVEVVDNVVVVDGASTDTTATTTTKETIIGYSYAGLFRTRSAYRFTIEDVIYLRHDLTAKGLGSILLKKLIDRCTELGYRQMITCSSDNPASVALHKKFGFHSPMVLKSVGFKFNQWIDTITMQLPLGESDTTLPPPLPSQ
ncbi:hypothetical protein DFA_01418 [Cavenderia fasciculata]|uniref:N-acetyltransferase domain-containing protein n=1 Tax=Cavenderia fasciculata TaxID=261658 RepID=F4PSQ4_CACFS|nr:uncharacterized protein DFA_01418 [Cavenderia fasciculata]EGG21532.1 hypothetical protein DFA_01418 [Cavenderia fasciculata]|eukprot:XP_004359382.1 hypothetical protein DFA_01418 [Cavenderia fasciculata]